MLKAFLLGIYEFRRAFTTHYRDLDHRHAYDLGRDLAHRLTFRRYED